MSPSGDGVMSPSGDGVMSPWGRWCDESVMEMV